MKLLLLAKEKLTIEEIDESITKCKLYPSWLVTIKGTPIFGNVCKHAYNKRLPYTTVYLTSDKLDDEDGKAFIKLMLPNEMKILYISKTNNERITGELLKNIFEQAKKLKIPVVKHSLEE